MNWILDSASEREEWRDLRVDEKKEKDREEREREVPPAATDSLVEKMSGIFMKKRHARQDKELQAHTHTHTHRRARTHTHTHTTKRCLYSQRESRLSFTLNSVHTHTNSHTQINTHTHSNKEEISNYHTRTRTHTRACVRAHTRAQIHCQGPATNVPLCWAGPITQSGV